MSRADKYPDQAEADMNRLHTEARQASNARDESVARAEALEREMDAAHAAGDQGVVEALQAQHQQAEIDVDNATSDFESIVDQIGSSQHFWYEEDDEEEDDEDD